jgi:DNA replication initiation complex subunit (GINS family)
LDIDIVRSIYQKYPNSFYEKLEEFLRELKWQRKKRKK